MSEELYRYYSDKGIELCGYIEQYYSNCYSPNKRRLLAIININYVDINEKNAKCL